MSAPVTDKQQWLICLCGEFISEAARHSSEMHGLKEAVCSGCLIIVWEFQSEEKKVLTSR